MTSRVTNNMDTIKGDVPKKAEDFKWNGETKILWLIRTTKGIAQKLVAVKSVTSSRGHLYLLQGPIRYNQTYPD